MSTIKTPDWDDCEFPGITSKNLKEPFSAIKGSVENGINVKAKYKGRTTIIKITQTSDTILEGIVTGFNPPAKQYEGLSMDDKVRIARDKICWHSKRK